MKLSIYTQEELFEIAKAIMVNSTGVQYSFNPGTFARALLQVSAMFGANASVQTLRLVASTSLEEADGVILDRLGLESGVPRLKKSPARVRGKFIPDPSPAVAAIAIPQKIQIIQAATSTQSEIAFETEAAASIVLGGTESNEISLVATENGIRSNGIASGSSLDLKFAINGVSHLLTTSDSGGGRSDQSNDEYRASIRDAKKSFGESTWAGIESLLKTLKLSNGSRITTAKIVEDFTSITNPITVYIDDGSGDSAIVAPLDTTTYPRASYPGSGYWEYTEQSTSLYVQLPYYHIGAWSSGINADIRKNGALLTYAFDYFVDIRTGKILFATPLVAGDVIRVWFTFYTGLVGLAAQYINGIYKSDSIKGWRPVGLPITIRGPATVTKPSVSASLTFENGFDSNYGRALASAMILTYLNSLGIGEAARYDIVNSICHKVPGVSYVTDLLLNGSAANVSPTNVNGVVRGNAATITV